MLPGTDSVQSSLSRLLPARVEDSISRQCRPASNYSFKRNITYGGRAARHFIMLRPPASGAVRLIQVLGAKDSKPKSFNAFQVSAFSSGLAFRVFGFVFGGSAVCFRIHSLVFGCFCSGNGSAYIPAGTEA